ncbi:MAG: aminotransferase class III-fold pyridoxal phosphate-dependent enzyme [Caldilineaceae bacterium]|nr:aminotransferase class III-fold pyridoxal phosphate-dependent enzyme [Caldilineaceae bacterium]
MISSGRPSGVNQLNTPGPRAKELLVRDHDSSSRSYYREHPLVLDGGVGTDVIDVDGNRYLDFTSGRTVNAIGHCHPAVVAAIQAQSSRLIYSSTTHYNEPRIQLSEELARLAPFQEEAATYLCTTSAETKSMAMRDAT